MGSTIIILKADVYLKSVLATLLRWLYNVMFTLAIPFDGLRLVWRARTLPGAHLRWCERLACYSPYKDDHPIIWLHAVSLGEAKLSISLTEALLQSYPQHRLLVTTTTLTGSRIVQQHFQQRVLHRYFPYDVAWVSRRFLNRVQPVLWIIFETELWPNHLYHCARRAIPVLLLNARLSQQSAQRYQGLKLLLPAMWRSLAAVGAQTEADRQRFIALGCAPEKITVLGNLKYELAVDPQYLIAAQQLRAHWGATRPVWMAASTHEGEEDIILHVFAELNSTFPGCLLILAPRHPQRFDKVATVLQKAKLNFVRRSQSTVRVDDTTEVLLLDTIGELNQYYAASDVAFVGGSLQPIGGHNILEAVAYQCAVVTGPHTFHFTEMIENFLQNEGLIVVADPKALLAALILLFSNPTQRRDLQQRAQTVLGQHRGVLAHNMDLIQQQLSATSRQSGSKNA